MFHAPIATGDGATPFPIRLRVLRLGAGVQSTTLALMTAHGVVGPMPDCAIFADTGWEPASVYALCAGSCHRTSCPSRSISFRPGISLTASSMPRAANAEPRFRHSLARSVAAQPITVFMTGSRAGGPFGIGR